LSWVSPTSHDVSVWLNEERAYDDDLGTQSELTVNGIAWSDYLILNHAALAGSTKVRFYTGMVKGFLFDKIEVDVFKDGSWVNVFAAGDAWVANAWNECVFAAGSVTKMRLRVHVNLAVPALCSFKEVDFWEVEAPPAAVLRRLLVGVGL